MTTSDFIALATAIGGLVTALVAIYLARSSKEKAESTAAEQVSSAWERLQGPLLKRIAELEADQEKSQLEIRRLKAQQAAQEAREKEKDARIADLEAAVQAAVTHIRALEARLDAAGIDSPNPPPILNDWLNNHEEGEG